MLAVTPLQVAHAAGVRYAKPAASGDCSSWATACSLQTALTGAVSGDEIWVVAGTYKPTTLETDRSATFQLMDGVALYGGFAGTETARSQRDPAVNVTILSGDIGTASDNSDNSYHVVTGATGYDVATPDGFTITAGNANGASDPNNRGGGMYNLNNSPVLTNVTFSGNSATSYGGGLHNKSSLSVRNTIFRGNTAPSGGAQVYNALYIYGGYWGSNVNDSVVQDGCPVGSDCENIITDDPMLGTLANHGGFTQTIPLLADSSAIDMGYDALCPATDQRGVTRPQGAHCDIIAYEYDYVPVVPYITRLNPSFTDLASVNFTVTFSESVTGVATGDFALPKTGAIGGESVTDVSGGPAIHTVTVNTGSGNGTLRLYMPSSATITDLAGNTLAGLPYAGGETYTVQRFYWISLPLIMR